MKVLVGVDGSSSSFAAVRLVGQLCSPDRDEIILVYAAPEASVVGEERLDEHVLERARTALSRAVFDEAISRLPDAWRSRLAEPEQVGGAPGAALLAAIDKHGSDLIAVGFRGTSLFERFVLGSVSRTVVHSARVPVLVVKSEAPHDAATERPAGESTSPFRVLAAYDGSEFGQRIAEFAHRISWPADAVGTVMTVIRPMFLTELPPWLQQHVRDPDIAAMADAWRAEQEQVCAETREQLRRFQQSLPACFAKSEPLMVEGRPAEKLLETLRNEPYNLAVMGGRGHSTIEELLVGSTTDEVLAKGPCSVLIVK
jgi:nucleotide-binding universal stress UspA family protein